MRPGRKRELVAETCDEWNVSIRRACRVLEFDTSTYHYKSRRRDQAGIEARIKDICATRVRYGYRRVHVMLTREGWDINMKRTYRIYRDLGLQLRNKTPKRRVKAKLLSSDGQFYELRRHPFLRSPGSRLMQGARTVRVGARLVSAGVLGLIRRLRS